LKTLVKQQVIFSWPEAVFISYSLFSWLSRFSNSTLIRYLGGFSTIEISFAISVFLTCVFIWISNSLRVDWYGKSKDNLIFHIINYLYKSISKKRLLSCLFFLDPFLFFIYYKNGNIYGIKNKIKTWALLLLSLFTASLVWLAIGLIINKIF